MRNVVLPQSDKWWEEGWIARGGKEVISNRQEAGEEGDASPKEHSLEKR